MSKNIIRALIVAVSILSLAASYGNVYVQSRTAKILKDPSFKAEKVATVKRGDKLALLERHARWHKVSYDGKVGWISFMVVGRRPPMNRLSIRDSRRGDIRQYARRRASVVTATAAVRGLAEDDRRRLGNRGAVDFDALEKVEALEISDSELATFIDQTK